LLDRKINTVMQHHGLNKLLGLDYTIVYKKGSDNKVVDALSRREEPINSLCSMQAPLLAISAIIPQWVQNVSSSYKDDPWINAFLQSLTPNVTPPHLTYTQGLLRWKGKICVGSTGS
jgi:hypothetical protein